RHTRFSRDWTSDVCSSDLSSRMSDLADAVAATTAPASTTKPKTQPRQLVSQRRARLGIAVVAAPHACHAVGPALRLTDRVTAIATTFGIGLLGPRAHAIVGVLQHRIDALG